MKREFLQGLKVDGKELSKDVIDQIMTENGKDIEAEKSKTTKAETERDTYKTNYDELEKTVKAYDGKTPEDYQKMITDAKASSDTTIAEMQKKLDDQAYDHKLDALLNKPDHKFASKMVMKQVRNEIKEKGMKFDGDNLLGFTDYMEDLKKNDPTAFSTSDGDPPPPPTWKPGQTKNEPNPEPEQGTLRDALKEKFGGKK